jgi:hypothetical protein
MQGCSAGMGWTFSGTKRLPAGRAETPRWLTLTSIRINLLGSAPAAGYLIPNELLCVYYYTYECYFSYCLHPFGVPDFFTLPYSALLRYKEPLLLSLLLIYRASLCRRSLY